MEADLRLIMAMPFMRRHIQNMSEASELEHHWGYPDRALPCTNDPGSCAYLDAVYWMHDVSMLYTFILWAVLGGLLSIWVLLRLMAPTPSGSNHRDEEKSDQKQKHNFGYRAWRATWALGRRYLLPEALQNWFGHVSRLQIVILACLCTYLTIFSFVGMVYQTWVTPVKKHPGVYNTRVTMGGFSDRIGALAYALTPFTVLLSSRESILSLLTGVPYQHFNFLHQWLGRVIFVQAFVHTLIWTVIEGRLYQPQPTVYNEFISQQYMVFGIIAMLFLTFLLIFSTKWCIKLTGYEFFRKTHYLIGVLYIAACWGHWTKLACWMIASLGLIGIDRGARLLRTVLLHVGWLKSGGGFKCAQAKLSYFLGNEEDSAVVRLDFDFNHDPWLVGQHFYLCFPALTIWQSHPFTPASLPAAHPAQPHHTYLIRAFKGETARLAKLAEKEPGCTTPVILTGPYGEGVLRPPRGIGMPADASTPNIIAIAGGTGISFTLPIVLEASRRSTGALEMVWMVRRANDLAWIEPELLELKQRMRAGFCERLKIRIFVTRDAGEDFSEAPKQLLAAAGGEKGFPALPDSTAVNPESSLEEVLRPHAGFEVQWLKDHHPSLQVKEDNDMLDKFMQRTTAGKILVVASGPAGLGRDLRTAVAARNDAGKVLAGDESGDVELIWDDRLTL